MKGILAAAVVAAPALLRAQAPGQTVNPSFEAASIKQNVSGGPASFIASPPGGRFMATNVPLRTLIAAAYSTPQSSANFRIIGGPGWTRSDRFDVAAKADRNDQQSAAGGLPTQLALMLRTLLAERFKLVVHHETREQPIYTLILARSDGKLGPRINRSETDCVALTAARRGGPPPAPLRPGAHPPCGINSGFGHFAGGAVSMTTLINFLTGTVDRVVVDESGLTGTFDFDLTWTPDQLPARAPGTPVDQPVTVNGMAIDPNGPSAFTALQEQLGLKLDARKGPVDVLVIDSVERPTEN